ncbi:hypothetical protein DFS34DRAFT_242669 [Phlyctochytrium arcticum]|nr:hypothetical protein DFS34DRAFT_242669 [Phlyctochytrium arcticum]
MRPVGEGWLGCGNPQGLPANVARNFLEPLSQSQQQQQQQQQPVHVPLDYASSNSIGHPASGALWAEGELGIEDLFLPQIEDLDTLFREFVESSGNDDGIRRGLTLDEQNLGQSSSQESLIQQPQQGRKRQAKEYEATSEVVLAFDENLAESGQDDHTAKGTQDDTDTRKLTGAGKVKRRTAALRKQLDVARKTVEGCPVGLDGEPIVQSPSSFLPPASGTADLLGSFFQSLHNQQQLPDLTVPPLSILTPEQQQFLLQHAQQPGGNLWLNALAAMSTAQKPAVPVATVKYMHARESTVQPLANGISGVVGDGESASTASSQKDRKRRKVDQACILCRKAHMSCDAARPCSRCAKRGMAHLCLDAPKRKEDPKRGVTCPVTIRPAPPKPAVAIIPIIPKPDEVTTAATSLIPAMSALFGAKVDDDDVPLSQHPAIAAAADDDDDNLTTSDQASPHLNAQNSLGHRSLYTQDGQEGDDVDLPLPHHASFTDSLFSQQVLSDQSSCIFQTRLPENHPPPTRSYDSHMMSQFEAVLEARLRPLMHRIQNLDAQVHHLNTGLSYFRQMTKHHAPVRDVGHGRFLQQMFDPALALSM